MAKGRTKRLTPIEQNELTSELNEMFLDQLMQEFNYERNTLDDKIEFLEIMLHHYKETKSMKGNK